MCKKRALSKFYLQHEGQHSAIHFRICSVIFSSLSMHWETGTEKKQSVCFIVYWLTRISCEYLAWSCANLDCCSYPEKFWIKMVEMQIWSSILIKCPVFEGLSSPKHYYYHYYYSRNMQFQFPSTRTSLIGIISTKADISASAPQDSIEFEIICNPVNSEEVVTGNF